MTPARGSGGNAKRAVMALPQAMSSLCRPELEGGGWEGTKGLLSKACQMHRHVRKTPFGKLALRSLSAASPATEDAKQQLKPHHVTRLGYHSVTNEEWQIRRYIVTRKVRSDI